jgi:hypothetical protein
MVDFPDSGRPSPDRGAEGQLAGTPHASMPEHVRDGNLVEPLLSFL